MMRLNAEQVAEIRAASGMYRASDVARTYDVHRSTVSRIWDGSIHADVRPAPEAPHVVSRPSPSNLAEDIKTMLERGMSPAAISEELGISLSSVYGLRGVWL